MLTNWQMNKLYITFVEVNPMQRSKEIVTDTYDSTDDSQMHRMEPNKD